jgi:hypothetical protein
LNEWLSILEGSQVPTEYVFSRVDNQAIQQEPWKTNDISNYIKTITQELDMGTLTDSNYTTHCFRRGGAQHRFFHAKTRWTLTEIKAWGGWAKGERNNTIIQYLLDDYVARETDSRFLCSPFKVSSIAAAGGQEEEQIEDDPMQRISILVRDVRSNDKKLSARKRN